jgi:hypothetical protein
MIKKLLSLAAACLMATTVAAGADWKQDILSYLGSPKDYPGALGYLQAAYPGLEETEKQTARAFLAYLSGKIGGREEERRWIVSYFELYRDIDPLFDFLDWESRRDFVDYWGRWKTAYPLVTDLNLLEAVGPNAGAPTAEIRIGVELANPAYYKISDEAGTLEGGLWQAGFHILTLPAGGLYDRSGVRSFTLDLKAGDLILRKRIGVDVDLQTPLGTSPAAPAAPAPRMRDITGEISLYIGDKLIMTSRKTISKSPTLTFPIPGPSAPNTKPYLAPRENDPMLNSASILDAVGLAYQTIRDLLKKKPPAPSPPTYQKVKRMAFALGEGGRVEIALKPGEAELLTR